MNNNDIWLYEYLLVTCGDAHTEQSRQEDGGDCSCQYKPLDAFGVAPAAYKQENTQDRAHILFIKQTFGSSN